jgi:hypothetical protein
MLYMVSIMLGLDEIYEPDVTQHMQKVLCGYSPCSELSKNTCCLPHLYTA